MAGESEAKWPKLLVSLKTKFRGILAALRAVGSALKRSNPKLETSRLRDRGPISAPFEDAKAHPPAPLPPVSEQELPNSYGRSKVSLMVVNPYLVYAHWNVDLTRLPPQTVRAALRFHDATEPSLPHSFEVDVDLATRNWYVHLWSPAHAYYADLGVKTADGGFTSLARSNRVHTPRAWPMAEVIHPAVPANSTSPVLAEPVSSKASAVATVEVSSRSEEIPGPLSYSPVPPVAITPQPHAPKPVLATEVLETKLSEIYSLRQWQPRGPSAAFTAQYEAAFSGSPEPLTPQPDIPLPSAQTATPLDLTTLAEHQFFRGSSSALLSSQTPEKHAG